MPHLMQYVLAKMILADERNRFSSSPSSCSASLISTSSSSSSTCASTCATKMSSLDTNWSLFLCEMGMTSSLSLQFTESSHQHHDLLQSNFDENSGHLDLSTTEDSFHHPSSSELRDVVEVDAVVDKTSVSSDFVREDTFSEGCGCEQVYCVCMDMLKVSRRERLPLNAEEGEVIRSYFKHHYMLFVTSSSSI